MSKFPRPLLLFLFVLVMLIVAALFIQTGKPKRSVKVTNFEQCQSAGFPVLESYPRQCTTPDGRLFVESMMSSHGDNFYNNQ